MWTYNYYPDYLYHHGVMGMKWGKRKARKSALKDFAKVKNPEKRWGILDAGNTAARTHYRGTHAKTWSQAQKQMKIQGRKEAHLTKKQIDAGRYRVSRFRTVKNMSVSALTGGTGAASLIAIGAGAVASSSIAPVALLGATSLGVATAVGVRGLSYNRDRYNYAKNANNE